MAQMDFLIPVKKTELTGGFHILSKRTTISSCSMADCIAIESLLKTLKSVKIKTGFNFSAAPGASIRILRDASILGNETYRLVISRDGVSIFSSGDAGAFYAIATLIDMIGFCGTKLPCCEINDWPDFKRRGVYLDCSRDKVPSLETLKGLVDHLAHWKINEVQLYIENVFSFKRHAAIGRGYSPFTAAEILELQEYCVKRYIRLVGSLASFGHMERILQLKPYTSLGEYAGFRGFAGGTTLCPTDPGSIKLISELYEEFVPLFRAIDFNVCGDEPWELGKGRTSRLAKKIGVGKIYTDFLLKIYRLCSKYGKRMNAWADIVLAHPECLKNLPADAVMLNWDYEAGGPRTSRTKEIAKAGLDFMACPGTSSWNTFGSRIDNAMTNIAEMASQALKYNGLGLLNTDWGDNGHRNLLAVSLHGFAAGAAHSWNTRAVDNKKFTLRFCRDLFGTAAAKQTASAIKNLGSTYLTCCAPHFNEDALFYCFYEQIIHCQLKFSRIDLVKPKGLLRIVAQLHDQNIWPKDIAGGTFEKLAIKEYKLASRMAVFAAQRALFAKLLRAGQGVEIKALRNLRSDLRGISNDFAKIWLSRNKPSRLKDNLALFKQVEDELNAIIG